ncbi:MAG: GNAT family N-acetyltransferase [Planctomycetaceae bacterium]
MNEADLIPIRPACGDDAATIVDFNCRLAWETEQKQLDREVVARGVAAVLADPRKARYFVACDGDRPVGQLMHTWEWSDWRNGDIWWLQSVYVHPDYRGRGVFRQLFEHLRQQAEVDPAVVGLRLYVEQDNTTAQEVYTRLGMSAPGYRVLELMPQ